jgi:hypothetical protein
MRITASDRRVYRAAFHALSHEGFPPEAKAKRGREFVRDYPEHQYPLTCAYIDAIMDWLSPSTEATLKNIKTVDQLIAYIH